MISCGSLMVEEAGVDQVHPHDAHAFLLQADVRIVQPHVDDHVVVGRSGAVWKRTPIQPWPLCGALVGAARHGVGEREELLGGVVLAV
jgi:hypothetical protein